MPYFDQKYTIYLIEEPRYFTDFNFHKLKLAFHRASMQKYKDRLKNDGYNVKYVEFHQVSDDFYKSVRKQVDKYPVSMIFTGDLVLQKKIEKLLKKVIIYPTLNHLLDENTQNTVYISHLQFYKDQRRRYGILMEKNGKPTGGKWSYDQENRQQYSQYKQYKVKQEEEIQGRNDDPYVLKAIEYVNKHFPNNPGFLKDNRYFIYPIDTKQSLQWLDNFLQTKIQHFGPFQDLVLKNDQNAFIFHSILSPMMNIGILTDSQVLERYMPLQRKIPLQSSEGFIRQVIGWRNYVYYMYLNHRQELFTSNLLKHEGKINKHFYEKLWTGNTSIIPIDDIINKIVKYSYAHHIERLMYLGNFLLLCQIHPKEVYKMFMEWTIDAYDWVMVPNVFGMSQYASDMMMKRPYFSSSNYILKMSDYKRDDWCDIMDCLYYNFINQHAKILSKNYSTVNQVNNWIQMKQNHKKDAKDIIETAQDYIENLFKKID